MRLTIRRLTLVKNYFLFLRIPCQQEIIFVRFGTSRNRLTSLEQTSTLLHGMGATPKTFIIGRGRDSDILLTHSSISRRHAELIVGADGNAEIRDLQSSGGTYLLRDGKEIPVTTAKLKTTDLLRLSSYDISVKDLLSLLPEEKSVVKSRPVPAANPAPGNAKSRMMRCACGSIKERGKPCPDCGT